VPVVAVFGGGTWPRFTPAARRGVALVQPLPCFGCGWDCVFEDAPCLGGISVADVTAALDATLTGAAKNSFTIQRVDHVAADVRELMGRAAARYRAMGAEHAIRQRKLEEKDAAILEKEREIDALKAVCNERERVIFILDGNVKTLQAELAKKSAMPAPTPAAEESILAALGATITTREAELAALRTSLAEREATLQRHLDGLTQLDQAKYLLGKLQEKERMLQILLRVCAEREALIRKLTAESTEPTARLRRFGLVAAGWWRARIAGPLRAWLDKKILDGYWMQIGILKHYEPRPLKWDPRVPRRRLPPERLPRIGIVTPSLNQATFLGSTMTSVLRQDYPHLLYVVQDGGSTDGSVDVIKRAAARLHHWESERDSGQADAIRKGFNHLAGQLAPDDLMAWFNSDDLLAPRALHAVARYFVEHPEVDVVYGHRIIIDDSDRDIGRWVMPRHDHAALEWIDYVPQESLFWRKRAWDRVGGLDPTFQFALDWDLIARFQQAGMKLVRLPWFLGAFRVHAAQKTSQQIHTLGHEEMTRIRTSLHGGAANIDPQMIEFYAHQTRVKGAWCARLAALGLRW
jgi:GT2 family glycosyltransferase